MKNFGDRKKNRKLIWMTRLQCLEILVWCLEKRKNLGKKREQFKYIKKIHIRRCFKKEIYNLINFTGIIQGLIYHKMISTIDVVAV
jgi:hypothetical protein